MIQEFDNLIIRKFDDLKIWKVENDETAIPSDIFRNHY